MKIIYLQICIVIISFLVTVTGAAKGRNRGNQLFIFGVCLSGNVDNVTSPCKTDIKVPPKPCNRASLFDSKDILIYLQQLSLLVKL